MCLGQSEETKKLLNLYSIIENQERKKDFSKNPENHGGLKFCIGFVLSFLILNHMLNLCDYRQIYLLSIIMFCAAFMKLISVFHKTKNFNGQNKAITVSSLISVQKRYNPN